MNLFSAKKMCKIFIYLENCIAVGGRIVEVKNETPMTKIKNFDTQTNDYNSIY